MWVELFLNRSANRASAGTRTATNTLVSVDYSLSVAFGDTLNRAFADASATIDAIVSNFVSHLYYLHFVFYVAIVT